MPKGEDMKEFGIGLAVLILFPLIAVCGVLWMIKGIGEATISLFDKTDYGYDE